MAAANTANLTKLQTAFLVKDTALRAVVGVSCGLSIIGSLVIILSYILFKKRRTRTREILLHISLMDLGVALANLIGLSVYFDKYFVNEVYDRTYKAPAYIRGFCKTQAFFAAFCTYSSILWTIALAGFLYFLIVHHKTRIAIYFYWISHIICYILPLMVSLWLVLTQRLGYSPVNSSGWCTLINRNIVTEKPDFFVTIFGNDLWVYLTIVTIPFLYMSIRCYLANQIKETKDYITPKRFWSSLHHVDYKFVIIPVVFVFLRIWTGIVNILYLYIRVDELAPYPLPQWLNNINQALLYLSGIGDSSQGFANAILFVIFTKNIRDSFIKCISCRKRGSARSDDGKEGANCEIQNPEHSSDTSQPSVPVLSGAELSASEEVSLVFGSLGSNKNHKLEHSSQY